MRKWLLLFFLVVSQFIFSQKDSLYTLPEIELISKHISKDSISFLEGKDIVIGNDNVLHTDVSGYLVQLPGVTIKDYGSEGGLKTVQIRGINAGLSTILLNGIKIPNSNTGQVDLSKIPFRGIRTIEQTNFLPNSFDLPASSYNGNGFVSLNTNEKNDSIIGGIRYGSFQLFNPFAHVSRGKKNKLHLSLDHLQTNGDFLFKDINNENKNRTNNKFSNSSFLGSYTIAFSKRTSLKLQQSINISEQQLPGAVIINSIQNSRQHLSNHHYNTNITFRHNTGKWNFSSYLTNYIQRTHYIDPIFLNSTNGLSNLYNEKNNTLAFNISRKWKQTSLFFSSEIEHNSLTSNTNISANRTTSNSIVGTRYHTKKINIQLSTLALTTNAKEQKNQHGFYPSIAITYKPINRLPIKVRGFYKSYYRIPSFSELYYQQVGNDQLQKEEAEQFNAGVFTHLKNKKRSLYISLDAFHILHKNKIVAIPTQNLFVWSYLNIGEVKSQGLELYTQFSTHINNNHKLSITGTYTKQLTKDISSHDGTIKNNQLPYIPIDAITGGLDYKHKKLSLNYQYRYSGFRFFHFENTFVNVLPAYSVHNIALSYHIQHKKNALISSIGIKNISNTQYSIIRSFPMPPRQFYFQLSYHI